MMKKYTTVNAPTAKLMIQKNWLIRTENGGVSLTSTGAMLGLAVGGRAGASRVVAGGGGTLRETSSCDGAGGGMLGGMLLESVTRLVTALLPGLR